MKREVLIEKAARKGLANSPSNVQNKFFKWVELIELIGLSEVRKVAGFHDEPLKGKG